MEEKDTGTSDAAPPADAPSAPRRRRRRETRRERLKAMAEQGIDPEDFPSVLNFYIQRAIDRQERVNANRFRQDEE